MPVLKCFASLATGRNMEEEKNICFSFVKKNQPNFEILQAGIVTPQERPLKAALQAMEHEMMNHNCTV